MDGIGRTNAAYRLLLYVQYIKKIIHTLNSYFHPSDNCVAWSSTLIPLNRTHPIGIVLEKKAIKHVVFAKFIQSQTKPTQTQTKATKEGDIVRWQMESKSQ